MEQDLAAIQNPQFLLFVPRYTCCNDFNLIVSFSSLIGHSYNSFSSLRMFNDAVIKSYCHILQISLEHREATTMNY